jgi:hypothetical protein
MRTTLMNRLIPTRGLSGAKARRPAVRKSSNLGGLIASVREAWQGREN